MSPTITPSLHLLFGGQRVAQVALAAFVVVALVLSLLLEDKREALQLLLTGFASLFWWLLAGARLLGFAYHALQLRVPRPLAHLPLTLLTGLSLTVLLPALLWWSLGSDFWSCLAVLALCASLGLFWASMPPWLMFAIIGGGILLQTLVQWPDSGPETWLMPHYLATLAAVLSALSTWFWVRIFRNGAPTNTWSLPIALALELIGENMDGRPIGQQQGGWMQQMGIGRIPDGLHDKPRAALSLALGPGFGWGLRSVIVESLWLVLIAALWLWLYAGKPLEGGNRIGLVFPVIMVVFSASMPMLRIWGLYRHPSRGLHELALLPGLEIPGEHRADSLAFAILRQQAIALSISLVLMSGYGWILHAPPVYYLTLLCVGLANAIFTAWLALLSARRRLNGGLLLLVLATLWITATATSVATSIGHAPAWLLPTWTVVGVLLLPVCAASRTTLKQQPHPYLSP